MFEILDFAVGGIVGLTGGTLGVVTLGGLRYRKRNAQALAAQQYDELHGKEDSPDEQPAVEGAKSPAKLLEESWAEVFYAYRDFLVGVIDGTSELSADKQLYKMIELLEISPRTLPNHQGTISFSGSEHPIMSLTYIYASKKKEGDDFRLRSEPRIASEPIYQVTSLFRAIATGYQASIHSTAFKEEGIRFRKKVEEFAKQYAAHLLLHYRKSPTEASPSPTRSALEERYARQDSLNKSAHLLKESASKFGRASSQDSLVEAALAVVPTLVDTRKEEAEASKALGENATEEEQFDARMEEFGKFGDAEAGIAQTYKKTEHKFIGDDFRDASKSLDKYFFAVSATEEAENLSGFDRSQVLELANHNKELARAELAELVRMLSSGQALNLVRALRIDNRYLAGRQETQLEGQKVNA